MRCFDVRIKTNRQNNIIVFEIKMSELIKIEECDNQTINWSLNIFCSILCFTDEK